MSTSFELYIPSSRTATNSSTHRGATKGSIIKFGGFDAYLVAPTGSVVHKNTAILYIPNIYSIYTNAQLIADQFAANGYYTIIPDVFRGDDFDKTTKDPDFGLILWLHGHQPKDVEPVVDAAPKYFTEEGYTKIGSVGYYFGAKYTVRYLAKERGVSVGLVAHPSFVDEDELKAATGPLSIATA
jgi:dienelactone hydrolase